MTRVTGKLQITLPKRLAEIYGIRVGDDVELMAAGESIAIVPLRALKTSLSMEERLRHFDEATLRQRVRKQKVPVHSPTRGWSRDELYDRGRTR